MIFSGLLVTTALAADPIPQATEATPTMPPPIIEFPGINRTQTLGGPNTIIPDTTGAAGHTHYMQAVNTSIALYMKDGTEVEMVDFNTFWLDALTETDCDGEWGFHQGQPT